MHFSPAPQALTQIERARELLGRQSTCFNRDEDPSRPNEIQLTSREHGDVGAEQPGRADIEEAVRLAGLLRDSCPALTIRVETIDEWVSVTASAEPK